MGVDLRFHVETKINGRWEHYNCGTAFRSYEFFDRIFTIEDEGKAMFPAKGLPDDISEVTKVSFERNDDGNFGMTWLTPDELNEVLESIDRDFVPEMGKIIKDRFGYLFNNWLWSFEKHRGDYPAKIESVRIIIWFDN